MSGESVVWSGKPTVLAFYDALVGGALLIAVSIALLATPLSAVVWLPALGAACGATLILTAFVKAWANSYTVTEGYVRRKYSFVAVRVDEAPLSKVTNVVVEQGVVGRVFGFGDLRFDTAGTSFAGVLFKGVRNPLKVKEQIGVKLKGKVNV